VTSSAENYSCWCFRPLKKIVFCNAVGRGCSSQVRMNDIVIGVEERTIVMLKVEGDLWKAACTTFRSRYFYAMLLYLCYATAMVMNNYFGTEDRENTVYVLFGVIHVIDAFLFLFSWEDKRFIDVETWPEYLNIAGSFLYLWSSTTYDNLYEIASDGGVSLSADFFKCRQIELVASILEVLATIGWIYVWHKGLVERFGSDFKTIPGRGYTVYDPDFHASWTLIGGAVLYLIYNIDLSRDPRRYDTSNVYELADIFYFVNAIAYMLSTLRDLGWFWMFPALCTSSEESTVDEEKTPLAPKEQRFLKIGNVCDRMP
jgi:hypothetical protein